jgi:hypothetical protein
MSTRSTARRLVAIGAVIGLVGANVPVTLGSIAWTPTEFLVAGELVDDEAGLDHIVLVYSGPLDPTSIPDPTDFTITIQDPAPPPSPGFTTQNPTSVTMPHVTVAFSW